MMKRTTALIFVTIIFLFSTILSGCYDGYSEVKEHAYEKGFDDGLTEAQSRLCDFHKDLEDEYGISIGEIVRLLEDIDLGKPVNRRKANAAWGYLEEYLSYVN